MSLHILAEVIGVDTTHDEAPTEVWTYVHNTMAREKGLMVVGMSSLISRRCQEWFMTAGFDDALDMIELAFQVVDTYIPRRYVMNHDDAAIPDAA